MTSLRRPGVCGAVVFSVVSVLTACTSVGPPVTPPIAATPSHVAATATAAPATPTPFPGGTVPVPVAGQLPTAGNPWYLVVGDSITSGFTRDPARAGVNAGWPVQLQPLLAATGRRWQVYDAACPGETTRTYFTGCPQHEKVSALPAIPQYQADLAAVALAPHDLKLIVVALGSNDLLGEARAGNTNPAIGAALGGRVDDIIAKLQRAAPGVPIVVANYYDPFENAQGGAELPVLAQINTTLAGIAHQRGATVADFFGVINTPAAPDPHLCVVIDCTNADIHPTVAGHAALARAVLAAIP